MRSEYLVQWDINIVAETAEEAAKEALRIQRDPNSIATHFAVTKACEGCKAYHEEDTKQVDLLLLEAGPHGLN